MVGTVVNKMRFDLDAVFEVSLAVRVPIFFRNLAGVVKGTALPGLSRSMGVMDFFMIGFSGNTKALPSCCLGVTDLGVVLREEDPFRISDLEVRVLYGMNTLRSLGVLELWLPRTFSRLSECSTGSVKGAWIELSSMISSEITKFSLLDFETRAPNLLSLVAEFEKYLGDLCGMGSRSTLLAMLYSDLIMSFIEYHV